MSITHHRNRIRATRASLSTRMAGITTGPRSDMRGPGLSMIRRTITTSSRPITACSSITLALTISTRC